MHTMSFTYTHRHTHKQTCKSATTAKFAGSVKCKWSAKFASPVGTPPSDLTSPNLTRTSKECRSCMRGIAARFSRSA